MVILLTGATGMLGTHVSNALRSKNIDFLAPTRLQLNLNSQSAVEEYLKKFKPTTVIHCAATVGGILENIDFPTKFILNNLVADSNIIEKSLTNNVKEFLYISSSCVYPRNYMQPLKEDYLLAGYLEPTNQSYAVAKIAGMQAMESISKEYGLAYRTIVPSNLYGPHDNFKESSSHLVASTIVKVHLAKKTNTKPVIYGSGTPRREFTYVLDLATWIADKIFNIRDFPQVMNVGSGVDYSILEYYKIASKVMGFQGDFEFDSSKPDGMFQKLLNSEIARDGFNWNPLTTMVEGLEKTYDWWLLNNGE